MVLERISSPGDVKELNEAELAVLCGELRRFLIDTISRTGGHLASNLGVVELTVAIHRVFDTQRDRLVFDVGHQCYVHKALTGRRELFSTLRQLGGLAGFPKPEESVHDAFIAGHASNSVSVALGMARARTLRREDYAVVALIGDGAMTGGLAYEGISDAGASGEPMVVILNDNGMSIDPNVGGIADHLGRLRGRPGYYRFKKWYRDLTTRMPGGRGLYRVTHTMKTNIKKAIYPCSLFEDMGFTYLGPVDGHRLDQLETTLAWAKRLHCPVLVHVRTRKGKGYPPAEERPELCHGVSPFDPAEGPLPSRAKDFSAAFGEALLELAKKDERVCAITAAMGPGTGLQSFAAAFPQRFFDVGIAEGHATAMAAGMAKAGMRPVFAVYSSFLQRGYDMLFHDVALQGLPVVFAVDRAGLVGPDGATHHGALDVGYLTQVPGMEVLCPATYRELGDMLAWAVARDGPVALRYPKGTEPDRLVRAEGPGTPAPAWNGEGAVKLREGHDVTLVSYGPLTEELVEAAETLSEKGIEAEVVRLCRLSPLPAEEALSPASITGRLLVLEDCLESGCVGQKLAAEAAKRGLSLQRVVLKNLGDRFAPHGSVSGLRRALGLDAGAVVEAVEEMMQ